MTVEAAAVEAAVAVREEPVSVEHRLLRLLRLHKR